MGANTSILRVAALRAARFGVSSTTWDGRNRADRVVARGVYFVSIVGPGVNEIRKVLVVK